MLVINPHPLDVLPLFRALHNYHVCLAPEVYHAEGRDADYLDHLAGARAAGGRVFAIDAGWGLVAYLLAMPEELPRDALRCGGRRMVLDHLYVAPSHRGRGLGRRLVSAMEDWMQEAGFDTWIVTYHAGNQEAGSSYGRMGAEPAIIRRVRRLG